MLGWNEQWVVLPRRRRSIILPRLPDLRLLPDGSGQWSSGGAPAAQGFRPAGVQGTGQAMDRASWALGQGLVHRVFLLPWGHLGSRARKGEGGLGRGKGGERASGKGKEAGREGVEGESGGESGKQPQVTGDFPVALPHNTVPPRLPHPPALQMAK